MAGREELSAAEVGPEERRAVIADCGEIFDLQVCGKRIRLRADDPASVGGFLSTYAAFRQAADPAAPVEMEIVVRRAASPRPNLLLLVRDRAYRSEEPALARDPEAAIEYVLMRHTQSHYLAHAGAVSRNGRGLIVAAASRMGKTTLTAFLVARGFAYLSDEIAPISRMDGSLWPYPLPLGIRPGPAETLARDLPGADFVRDGDRKKLVRPADFSPAGASGPVPLHAVVFITGRLSTEVRTARRFDGLVVVSFNGMTPEFRSELLERTASEWLSESRIADRVHALTLCTRAPDRFPDGLRAAARAHDIGIIRIEHEDLDPCDFDAEPRLLRLPAAAGVLELAEKNGSAQKAELMRTQFAGRMTGLLEELARRVGGVAFYKITPGRIEAMIGAVKSLS